LPEESQPTGKALTPGLKRWIRAPDFWTPVLQEESLPAESALTTGTQVRVGLPGVLTDANRIKEDQAPARDSLNINTRDYQMAKGKCKNLTIRNQEHWASSGPSMPTTESTGYPNTTEKQDSDLKSYVMMVVDFKKNINNSLKEIQLEALKELQENTAKQVEVLKEETQNSLKELQETTKQEMELNKTIQDQNMEVETMKKIQRETTREIETQGEKSGTIERKPKVRQCWR
jgi:chromosome segregation ATPase